MLDTNFRNPYQKALINPILHFKFIQKIHPNLVTLLSTFFGIFSFFSIVFGHKYLASFLLLISGYFDTLDGSIARYNKSFSNLGSVLDIFSDRFVEALIIIALFLVDPHKRAFLSILMFFSSYLCITSFLVVGIFLKNQSEKSFQYSAGIIERTEAFIFYILMILFYKYFEILAFTYSVLIFLTAFIRIFEFIKHYKCQTT